MSICVFFQDFDSSGSASGVSRSRRPSMGEGCLLVMSHEAMPLQPLGIVHLPFAVDGDAIDSAFFPGGGDSPQGRGDVFDLRAVVADVDCPRRQEFRESVRNRSGAEFPSAHLSNLSSGRCRISSMGAKWRTSCSSRMPCSSRDAIESDDVMSGHRRRGPARRASAAGQLFPGSSLKSRR